MNYITSRNLVSLLSIALVCIDFCAGQACGQQAIAPKNSLLEKIVGGTVVNPNSWPWQVYIATSSSACGASLINDQWLLTAAHCNFAANTVVAYLGNHDLTVATTVATSSRVTQSIPHPNYDDVEISNDIRLLKLAVPITFTSQISPICLPLSRVASINDILTVTGWGATSSGGSTSSKLLQTAVTVNQDSTCTQQFGIASLTSSQLCAGQFDPAHDSCQGDSGGPLVKLDTASNTYWQVGIVSFGVGCAGHGIYTKVSEYETWIAATIAAYPGNDEVTPLVSSNSFRLGANVFLISLLFSIFGCLL